MPCELRAVRVLYEIQHRKSKIQPLDIPHMEGSPRVTIVRPGAYTGPAAPPWSARSSSGRSKSATPSRGRGSVGAGGLIASIGVPLPPGSDLWFAQAFPASPTLFVGAGATGEPATPGSASGGAASRFMLTSTLRSGEEEVRVGVWSHAPAQAPIPLRTGRPAGSCPWLVCPQVAQRFQEVESLRSRKPVFKRIKEVLRRNRELEGLVRYQYQCSGLSPHRVLNVQGFNPFVPVFPPDLPIPGGQAGCRDPAAAVGPRCGPSVLAVPCCRV